MKKKREENIEIAKIKDFKVELLFPQAEQFKNENKMNIKTAREEEEEKKHVICC